MSDIILKVSFITSPLVVKMIQVVDDGTLTNTHTHENKSILDAIQQALTNTLKNSYDSAVTAKHTHSNKNVLDNTQESFTTELKTAYNNKKDGTYKGWYDAEIVASPTTGTLTLKNSTETVLEGALTSSNVFTVALPAPTAGKVNESILIFAIGATLPTITQPTGIVWRGAVPTLAINTAWVICYEQVNTTGTTFVIRATAIKNV